MPIGKIESTVFAVVLGFYALPAFAEQQHPPLDAPTPVAWADGETKSSTAIRRALDSPLNSAGIEVQDAPLAEVIDFLRAEYNIEVQLDVPALDDLGLSSNDPIYCNLRNISLGAALNLMLKQLDLTYVIADEVLLVTSEEEALTRLTVGVYPVGDLLAAKGDGDSKPEDINQLINTIISCVASDTWVENGGPEAEITAMQPGLLVVSQTQDVHAQLAGLLSALRRAKSHEFAIRHEDGGISSTAQARNDMVQYLRRAFGSNETESADEPTDEPDVDQQRGGGMF